MKVELILEFEGVNTESQLFSLGMSIGRIIRELEFTTRTRFGVRFNIYDEPENICENDSKNEPECRDSPEVR